MVKMLEEECVVEEAVRPDDRAVRSIKVTPTSQPTSICLNLQQGQAPHDVVTARLAFEPTALSLVEDQPMVKMLEAEYVVEEAVRADDRAVRSIKVTSDMLTIKHMPWICTKARHHMTAPRPGTT